MKRVKLSIITLLLLTLSACDNGTINGNKECGMSSNNEFRVEGFNTEICKEDKVAQLEATLFGKFHNDILPEKHSAKKIQSTIDSDQSKQSIQEEISTQAGIASKTIILYFYIIGIVGVISGYFIFIYSKTINEKTDYDLKEDRYSFKIVISIVAIGLFLSIPYGNNYTVGQRIAAQAFFVWPKMLFNNLNSFYIASKQTGDVLTDNKSENVVLDSLSAFKANALTVSLTKGILTDLRTAKYSFEKTLERKVEHNEPLKMTITGDTISIDRYVNGRILNQINKIEFHKQSLSSAFANKAFNDSIDTHITSDINSLESSSVNFKNTFIQNSGYDKNDSRVNQASQLFIVESLKLALFNKIESTLHKHYELARLIEETACYDGKKSSNNISILHNSQLYINYLNNENNDPFGSIACISEPEKSKFVQMGTKSKEQLEQEIEALNKEVFNEYYNLFRELEVVLVKTTLDAGNSFYCKKARQEGYLAAILYDNKCSESNYVNRKLMNTIAASFTVKDYSSSSFVQTEFTKQDMTRSPLLNNDFDGEIRKLTSQIGVDPNTALLNNQSEFIDYIINSDVSYGEKDAMKLFTEPVKTFKRKIGISNNDCDLDFTACVDINKFNSALNEMSDDLINAAIIPFSIAVLGGAATNRLDKADDKSDVSKLEYGKKSKNKKNKSKSKSKVSFIQTLFSAMTALAGFMLLLGTYSKIAINFVPLFFSLVMIIATIHIAVSFISYPLRFSWMLYVNDSNNIKSNSRKIVGELVYLFLLPAIIFSCYLIAKTLMTVAIASLISVLLSDSSGFVELIARSAIIIPLIHLMTMGIIRNLFIDVLKLISESLIGENTALDLMTDTLQKAITILSFGINLSFIYNIKSKRG